MMLSLPDQCVIGNGKRAYRNVAGRGIGSDIAAHQAIISAFRLGLFVQVPQDRPLLNRASALSINPGLVSHEHCLWKDARPYGNNPANCLQKHRVTGPREPKRTFRAEGFRRINRPSGFLPYFFNPAVQLSTTVMGVGDGSPACVLTRKRWPSRLGT
jgi:hypothetical protein